MKVNNNIGINQSNMNNEKAKNSLSIDDFLQIMAAEIKNQNPMGSDSGSGSNTDYISQLAQFTTLEHMTEISQSLNLLNLMGQQQQSFSLIGKNVSLSDNGEIVTGIVDKVKFQNGYAILRVNNKDYYLSSVMEVSNPEVRENTNI